MADPVVEPLEQRAREIGELIGGALKLHALENPNSPPVGFTLMLFTMEDGGEKGWMTYISSAQRDSMLEAMEDFLEKHRQMDGSG